MEKVRNAYQMTSQQVVGSVHTLTAKIGIGQIPVNVLFCCAKTSLASDALVIPQQAVLGSSAV